MHLCIPIHYWRTVTEVDKYWIMKGLNFKLHEFDRVDSPATCMFNSFLWLLSLEGDALGAEGQICEWWEKLGRVAQSTAQKPLFICVLMQKIWTEVLHLFSIHVFREKHF